MRGVVIPLVLLALILGVLYAAWMQFGRHTTGVGPGGERVLIVYDVPSGPDDAPAETVSARSLAQLLCHFDVAITLVSTKDYEKGMANDASYVLYVGTKTGQPLPSDFIDDVFGATVPVMWIGANLERLEARHSMENFGYKLADTEDRFLTNDVEYKNHRFAKIDLSTFSVRVTRPSTVRVLAKARYVDNPLKPAQAGFEPTPGTPGEAGSGGYGGMAPGASDVAPTPTATPDPEPDLMAAASTLAPVGTPAGLPPGAPAPPKIEVPWILQGNNLWYVASDPLAFTVEGGAYVAFADVLYDFLGQPAAGEHPAFVRLEDIHAKRDAATLRKAADLLYERGVPFTFTMTPVYKNPATDETIFLTEAPQFIETIRYLIARGGAPILHGYTHQFSGETAVDFEFWNPYSGEPIESADETYASERVEKALNECFLARIFPLAWTTPHYAAGQTHYRAFANYFTTVVERRMPVELFGSDQFFPYLIKRDMHGQIVIPETLGYVNPAAGRAPADLLRDADAMKVVRDGWASFFFHTFLDLDLLAEMVDGLRDRGFKFVSLTEFNNKVTTASRVVASGVTEVRLTLDAQYKHEMTLAADGEMVEENYSVGTITGDVEKYVSLRPGQIQVVEGVYRRPAFSLANLGMFRPTLSGVTSPVALALLFIGLMTLVVFLAIWVFLVTRKTMQDVRGSVTGPTREGF
ncbi:polysaccharide deacetylase family protein [bacterium]|nr:polysaccharide deacetylase family protein [bacterium]